MSETTNETVQPVIQSISDSGLPDEVKKRLVNEINSNAEDIAKKIDSSVYRPPEDNDPWDLTRYLMSDVIVPILQENQVPEPVGRDLSRDIYKALGGTDTVKYETK
jgi:hypothetical protein|tara:strand:- start:348 stop:665 length:318 start_codon:yes stop_codon:yes gene_type:complete